MALPSSGQITINQMHVEAGGSSASEATINDADIRVMIGKSDGAQNAFNEYYGASSSQPTATYLGRSTTTGDGFPSGYFTLSSGTKLVVYCMQLAGVSSTTANSYVSLGGTNMTLAARKRQGHPQGDAYPTGVYGLIYDCAIYYAVTSASGSTYVTGNGGSGRSSGTMYEITGYNSSTPYTTDTAINTEIDNTTTITVDSNYNGITIGVGMSEDGSTTTVSNADEVQQVHLESATAHVSWKDEGTPSGNRSYTFTTTPASFIRGSGTAITLVTASWK